MANSNSVSQMCGWSFECPARLQVFLPTPSVVFAFFISIFHLSERPMLPLLQSIWVLLSGWHLSWIVSLVYAASSTEMAFGRFPGHVCTYDDDDARRMELAYNQAMKRERLGNIGWKWDITLHSITTFYCTRFQSKVHNKTYIPNINKWRWYSSFSMQNIGYLPTRNLAPCT